MRTRSTRPRRPPPTCAFCGRRATTTDHIPSRNFFRTPRPTNLITVPACATCNGGTSADEEYFLLRVLVGASSQEAEILNEQRLSRILTPKRLRAINAVVNDMTRRPQFSPAGLYLGEVYEVRLDHDIIRRVLTKIIRGLYFHVFRQRVPDDFVVVVASYFAPEHGLAHGLTAELLGATPLRARGASIFEYKCQRTADNPQAAMFLMQFLGSVPASGAVVRASTLPAHLHPPAPNRA